jgi:hypothetical protein
MNLSAIVLNQEMMSDEIYTPVLKKLQGLFNQLLKQTDEAQAIIDSKPQVAA